MLYLKWLPIIQKLLTCTAACKFSKTKAVILRNDTVPDLKAAAITQEFLDKHP